MVRTNRTVCTVILLFVTWSCAPNARNFHPLTLLSHGVLAKPSDEKIRRPVSPSAIPPSVLSASSEVDLRAFDSPVDSQVGKLCSTYATKAAMDNLIHSKGYLTDVSVRHLWSLYLQYDVEAAVQAAGTSPVVPEEVWPEETIIEPEDIGKQVDRGGAKILKSSILGSDVPAALKALDAHHPLVVGLRVTHSMRVCDAFIDENSKSLFGDHALAVVGYKKDETISGGGYFILKNSWGPECGDKGYQYYPFSMCSRPDLYCDFIEIADIEVKADPKK